MKTEVIILGGFVVIAVAIYIICTIAKYFRKKEGSTDQEAIDDEDTYEVETTCSNCHENTYINIKRGTKVFGQLEKIECETCGCVGTLKYDD